MKILLLTRNHVVREFIGLVSDRVEAELIVVKDSSDISDGSYDFFFVDARGDLLEQGIAMLERFSDSKTVVLYNKLSEVHELFDIKVSKPFLPSDIQDILLDTSGDRDDQVLDAESIQEIKSLLEDDEMETISEDALATEVCPAKKEKQKKKRKNKKKKYENIDGIKFLQSISKMSQEDIQTLFSGAKVKITINFPKVK